MHRNTSSTNIKSLTGLNRPVIGRNEAIQSNVLDCLPSARASPFTAFAMTLRYSIILMVYTFWKTKNSVEFIFLPYHKVSTPTLSDNSSHAARAT
jgi:hypothetical protein